MTTVPPAAPRTPPPDRVGGDPAADALWQYLAQIEDGLRHIEARIDHLYLAIGGGTLILAAIGLAAGFIARGAP